MKKTPLNTTLAGNLPIMMPAAKWICMKPHTILFLLFLLFLPHCVRGQWNSFIINFDKASYGKGTQTWQIVPYKERWVYFANRNGMLQYDGNSWQLFPLNNFSDVRSVMLSEDEGRIYVGGINEFGYYEPDGSGMLRYRCLSDTLGELTAHIGNVWGIHQSENVLYFQGDGQVVRYVNGKYSVVHAGVKIDCSGMANDILYIGTNRGIRLLVGNAFFPLQGADALEQERIRGIIPYKNGILVATAYRGLYFCDGRTMTPFLTEAEEFLRENEVFCMAVSGEQIALGTIHKGVVLVDCATKRLRFFNENNGLRNNTVLSLSFDQAGNLWAGLDSGIDYICLNSPFTNLCSYPYSCGTGYTAALQGDRLYLGTNRGLYYVPYPVRIDGNASDVRPVPHSSGQVWNLCRIGEELLCLHDRGVFRVTDAGLVRQSDITGVWCCRPLPGRSDRMYAGLYGGLCLMEKREGQWHLLHKVEGFTDSCRQFELESDRVLWIVNAGMMTRLELDSTLTYVVSRKDYGAAEGLPDDRSARVANIDGRICFFTARGVYQYNAQQERMELCAELNNLLNGNTSYVHLGAYHRRLVSLSTHEVCVADLDTYKRRTYTGIYPIRQPLMGLVSGFETLIPLSDSLIVIPNEDGFALLTLPTAREVREADHSLCIRNMYLSYPKDSLLYMANFRGEKPLPVIAHSLNSVRFEFGLSHLSMSDDVRFQYRLNKERWSDFTTTCTKEYSNLSEGEYTFEVKALFPNGTTATDSFTFCVLPPWYRTSAAYTVYLLILACLLWGLYRWDNVRVRRKEQQAVVEKDRELHQMEQEYEEEKALHEKQIMQLEKEKLEHELQHKSQEMANLMINFVRKNEMLNEIKSEIVRVAAMLKGEGSREGRQQLVLLNGKIDANIQSDEVLKRIEEQFDLLHNNFMKRLHARHPDLSDNERMMCAYLIMNLSTKEIAPLLNISVRGVETVRYRLRKKFGLEREQSLTDYLNNEL